LAQGEISTKQALILGVILVILAFLLVLFLNVLTILMSVIALLLACLYPLAKRLTHWPQFVLGLAFNFGILMAFTAISNHLPFDAWYLYAISIIWTLSYDTYYALADVKDDLLIGIKSTAVKFGQNASHFIMILQGLMLLGLIGFGLFNHYSLLFYGFVLCCAPLFYYELRLSRQDFIKAFSHNHWVGFIIFLGFITQF
jgi:4-hydroxybenzoate polyprenyltransferase